MMGPVLDLDPETARQRLLRARFRARPERLWPDLRPDQLQDALKVIAEMAGAALLNERKQVLAEADQALSVAGYVSGMGPLLGYWIECGLIDAPADVEDIFSLHLRHNRRRMLRLTAEAVAMARLFDGAGITPTIIKGMHTAHAYFPEPGTRPVSDIDLVMGSTGAMNAAQRLLSERGYLPGPLIIPENRQDWRRPDVPETPRSLDFVHQDDPWTIDLQASFDRHFPAGKIVRLDELASSAAMAAWPLSDCANVLPQPLLTLHLAVHASQGFNSLTLMRLTELALVIRADRANGILIWEEFVELADRIGALGFVYPAFLFTEELAAGTIPADILARCAAAAPRAVRRFLSGHTCWSVQRIHRWSRQEAFVWCDDIFGRIRAVAGYLTPRTDTSLRGVASLYRRQIGIALRLMNSN